MRSRHTAPAAAAIVDDAGQPHVLWHTSDSITGSPVIGGGCVWALDTSAGVLHALYGADVIVPTLAGIAVVRTS